MDDNKQDKNQEKIKINKKGTLVDKDIVIQSVLIGILTVALWYFEPLAGFVATLILGYSIFQNIKRADRTEKDFVRYIEGLSDDFDSATKHAIFNMPFPLVMINDQNIVTWYNTPFLNLFDKKDIINEHIGDIMPGLNGAEMFNQDNEPISISCNDKHYRVYPNMVDTKKTKSKNDGIIMLYFVNETDYVNLSRRYKDERLVVSFVYVDNFTDVKNSTPDIKEPLVLAEIDRKVIQYFTERKAIIRKYDKDKYLALYNRALFEELEDKNFDILDEFRTLDIGNTIPITLSIGTSIKGEDLSEAYREAKAAIDVALGRGGDQVVVQKGNKLEFFGGKSKALEKRNKVKSRVIGYALRQLIDQADEIFVMGHKNPDMDSFGAGIGILSAVKERGKNGYLVLNDINPSIKVIYEAMKEREPELLDRIVTTEEAQAMVSPKSLMVVVDNHKPSFTEAPVLLDEIEKVVLIDHHRRGEEFIKNPILVYLEPYASSTCELVTEVLTYMGDKINITKFEAEALLAGITVDTKNFSFQTGVRTFEAATTLKRAGADSTTVKEFFKDDIENFILKAEVVQRAHVIKKKIAISRIDREVENSILLAAQSADELLSASGIEASFVLAKVGEIIYISGRSLGNISVQLILEKLGGGGHLTSAGAQLEADMEEAENKLIETIEEYFEEEEK